MNANSAKSNVGLETAKLYTVLLIATIGSLFKQIGRAVMRAYENATSRFHLYAGLSAGAAIGFQLYLAILTGGASLLLAPLAIAYDVVVLTGISLIFDTVGQLVAQGAISLYGKARVLYTKWTTRRRFEACHAQAATMRAVS